MATAAVAPTSLTRQPSVPIEDLNFLRLFLLIKKIGTKVCYDIFHRYFSKNKKILYQQLLPFKKILKPFLFQSQFDLIFGDPNQETDSTQYDITLFLLLIRKTCPMLQPPRKGWNRRPSQSDISDGANLERLRTERNFLAHSGSEALKIAVFNKRWQDARIILLALGADPIEIDEYLKMPLDNTNFNLEEEISIMHDILFQHIDVSFTKYSENEKKIDSLQEEITKLQDKLHTNNLELNLTIEDIERRLKARYIRSECIISCLEWDVNHKGFFRLEDIYIEPHICKWKQRRSVSAEEELNLMSIYEVLKIRRHNPVNACFISDPGKGKSVLMKKLALDYARNDEKFQEQLPGISLVVLIRCKELSVYQTLQDYIEDKIIKDSSIDSNRLVRLLHQNSQQCLFLIDGLDEILHSEDLEIINELYSLLEGRSYNNASIIATTRPSGLKTLEKQLVLFRETYIITALKDKDIREYITKFFSEKDEDYCTGLYESIVNNDNIRELVSSPLTLSIVCNIYEHASPVPKNITQLYHELVRQMIQQFKIYYGFGESRQGVRRVSECLLKSVGHVAFQSLRSGNDYFEQNDLVDYFVTKQKRSGIFSRAKKWIKGLNATSVLQLGFITADAGSNPRKVNWRYQFEPKMCQKYIAAEYIVNNLLKHGMRSVNTLLAVETGGSLSSSPILKSNHELCLFIVDSLGRKGEKQLCKELFNTLFKDFGSI